MGNRRVSLASRFPLLSVEGGWIVSKDADATACFRVELPEVFTLTEGEYEALHSGWAKALGVLPPFTVVHKQDWFVRDAFRPAGGGGGEDGGSFLSRASDMHFWERPFLRHECYLYVTKLARPGRVRRGEFSSLCRGRLVPRGSGGAEMARFSESVEQFARILGEVPQLGLSRLDDDAIVGSAAAEGLLDRYLRLGAGGPAALEDLHLEGGGLRVGAQRVCLHTLSTTEDLPLLVGTDVRHEALSTDRSDCRLSFASPVGLLLGHDHMYNQYVLIGDGAKDLQRFERDARRMLSLSEYSRANQINREWIEDYLNTSHSLGMPPVRAHFNVLAWADTEEALRGVRNDVGAALASMGCQPRHNTVDTAVLFWAGMPGNAGDLPAEEAFYTFAPQALCLFAWETNYRDSPSPFGIRLVDRISGRPVHVDLSDLPMARGVITNRNKFILGPSGSGKSFFTNHMVRQYWEQGAHVLLVDTGNSYEGLCNLVRARTGGADGVYFTYTDEHPISFNPFYTDDYVFDIEKRESISTLLLALWKSSEERVTKTESGELGTAVSAYIELIRGDRSVRPCFDTFYEYLRDVYRGELAARDIAVPREDFNVDNLLTTLRQYYRGGRYDFLLNSAENIDLLGKRLIVFEIDAIKDNKDLFPVVTIIIMEAFINKMRRLKGVRKMILIEEAWKAIASANMADYIKYLYKTVRKYFGEAIVVTQEVDDIIQSPIVKESIINNSDCKILLDQRKYMAKFDGIQAMLGLSEKEKSQILSINLDNDPGRMYREVWIGLGGTQSAVYGTEVSRAEYLAYTTEEREKVEVMALAGRLGGDVEGAIRMLTRVADEG